MFIYKGIHTSGRNFDTYCKLLKINPREYKTILDVGSGLSTFTSSCLENGIESYGVDIGYSDLEAMVDKYLNQLVPPTLEGIKEKFKNLVGNCQTIEEARDKIMSMRKTKIEDFFEALEKNKGNYIAGSSTTLPFSDNSFDLAVCVELIGHHSYLNHSDKIKSIKEMKRVAREVRIYSSSLKNNPQLSPTFLHTGNEKSFRNPKGLIIIN